MNLVEKDGAVCSESLLEYVDEVFHGAMMTCDSKFYKYRKYTINGE